MEMGMKIDMKWDDHCSLWGEHVKPTLQLTIPIILSIFMSPNKEKSKY